VDDAGSFDTTDPRQIVAVVEQSVDQGAPGITGGRMDDQTWRFVEDQEVVILVEDREGNRFGLDVTRRDGRFVDHERISRMDDVGRSSRLTVEVDTSVVDQLAGPGP
jgi:hypothetical protein